MFLIGHLEARAGIEPAMKALQAPALPLCYLAIIKLGIKNYELRIYQILSVFNSQFIIFK